MINTITSEKEVAALIHDDEWMMDVLQAAQKLDLADWWIGAGFLRSKVWNYIEGIDAKATRDVDLVYFNVGDISAETDWSYDEKMKKDFPFANWEVRNQARMHYVNNFEPYKSTEDGISHWVETATCVAVRLENDELKFLFCYGTDDLFGLIARPIDQFKNPELIEIFHSRVKNKKWRQQWPDLKIKF